MNTLKVPCPVGEISDGYHTFNELYEHRHALFLVLMSLNKDKAWFSSKHHDGTEMEGWFIAGINTPQGQVTYHLPNSHWTRAILTGAKSLEVGEKWDGHTSQQVVMRFFRWAANLAAIAPSIAP